MNSPSLANSKNVGNSERYDDVYTDYFLDNIVSAERDKQSFVFKTKSGVAMRISVYAPTIFKFQYAHRGTFLDTPSYAIQTEFKAIDTALNFIEEDSFFCISSDAIHCHIAKKDATVVLTDGKGNIINEDSIGFSARTTIHTGLCKVSITKRSPKKEQYFGLGDKTCSLNLRGQDCDNYNTDQYAYGEGSYPLYRSIPFYYGLRKGRAYGIFMDNTHRSHFDFDSKKDGKTTFWAEGGEMSYYFIYGPALLDVARQYHHMTGVTELPSMWSLGFHQCRWSYYPDARVREVAADFRKHQIPCDAIYLDIDYMDDYRCFTVNKQLFPDLKQLAGDLKKEGFSTIVMIDPGIKVDQQYWVYQSGMKKEVFCRRPDGSLMIGPVWPSECVFPDFTNPKARAWWEDLYKELYGMDDIAGFWNDMNEPAVFKVNSKTFPDNVLHDCDGRGGSHKEVHNIYGMQMSMATKDGLLKIKPNERPFVLTRATYSGGQRYAAVWTGDNVATWEHLNLANRQCQRLSLSGFSLVGSDIGGFVDQPTGELMARWLQLGIFHPLYRVHSMGNNADGSGAVVDNIMELDAVDRQDQEPWSYGDEFTAINRKAIELRYRLLAYIYTAFEKHANDGTPLIKSMRFYDQKDKNLIDTERDFIFGEQLLISPVVREKAKRQEVYLPKGKWFNFWTNKYYKGKDTVRVKTPIDQIPMFVKAGTVLPLYPVRQHTKEKIEFLDLHIYAGTETSYLYEDAGNGFEYQKGQYRRVQFDSRLEKEQFQVSTAIEGSYKVAYTTVNLSIHPKKQNYTSLLVDGKAEKFTTAKDGTIQASIKGLFKELVLR